MKRTLIAIAAAALVLGACAAEDEAADVELVVPIADVEAVTVTTEAPTTTQSTTTTTLAPTTTTTQAPNTTTTVAAFSDLEIAEMAAVITLSSTFPGASDDQILAVLYQLCDLAGEYDSGTALALALATEAMDTPGMAEDMGAVLGVAAYTPLFCSASEYPVVTEAYDFVTNY
jgi:hypothetical protein